MLHRLQQRKIVQKATAHRVHNVFQKLKQKRKKQCQYDVNSFLFFTFATKLWYV